MTMLTPCALDANTCRRALAVVASVLAIAVGARSNAKPEGERTHSNANETYRVEGTVVDGQSPVLGARILVGFKEGGGPPAEVVSGPSGEFNWHGPKRDIVITVLKAEYKEFTQEVAVNDTRNKLTLTLARRDVLAEILARFSREHVCEKRLVLLEQVGNHGQESVKQGRTDEVQRVKIALEGVTNGVTSYSEMERVVAKRCVVRFDDTGCTGVSTQLNQELAKDRASLLARTQNSTDRDLLAITYRLKCVRNPNFVAVSEVSPSAMTTGLVAGDVIFSINGAEVHSLDDWNRLLLPEASSVRLEYWKDDPEGGKGPVDQPVPVTVSRASLAGVRLRSADLKDLRFLL